MNTTEIKKTELLPILGVTLRKVGPSWHVGPCPFCGGTDRFTVKSTPEGDKWHCRQCGDGKYHTVIDYIMRRDNCDFKTAIQSLGSSPVLSQVVSTTTKKQLPKEQKTRIPDKETQSRMMSAMMRDADTLLTDAGIDAQAYLINRGIQPSTWEAWHLGYATIHDPKSGRKRPALSIPWYYMDKDNEFISAIKYRFIDRDPNGLRYTSAPGSIPVLYGLWDAIETDNTLLLVEGEINALSLWQCRPQNVTVLSIGSEGGGREDAIRKLSAIYQRIFVWCDDAEKTRKYQRMIIRPSEGLQSPIIDGEKVDANRLLQEDLLDDFIRSMLKVNTEKRI